jgi:RsmE family RNA methyltransferase
VNLIILEPRELIDDQVTLVDGRAAHLLDILNVTPGQTVRIGQLDGPLGTGRVTAVARGSVTLHCGFDDAAPPIPPVDLLLAVPRPKVLRRLWAQLAALGVGRIILTNAERVERNYFDTHVLSPDTYRPLLVEGLQQARDTRLPQVSVHRRFRILVDDHLDALSDASTRLVADPRARTSPGEAISARPGERVLLAIGPEGGWNDFELELLGRHRFHPVGMGSRTLRTDTACVALLMLVHQALQRG